MSIRETIEYFEINTKSRKEKKKSIIFPYFHINFVLKGISKEIISQ